MQLSQTLADKARTPPLMLERVVSDVIDRVINLAISRNDELVTAIETLPAPIYLTGPEGVITHFNRACIGFAGRTPSAGRDRWCVSWKLYTDAGEFLPHDECPMALALQTRRPIRGVAAIAERPDGARVKFMPFPSPIFGMGGELVGAVNLLIDSTDVRETSDLLDQAERCRRLAKNVGDRDVSDTLRNMAAEYELKSREIARSVGRLEEWLGSH